MHSAMSLRHDPYRCFRRSASPVGLYARQKWIALEGDAHWQTDFDECTGLLRNGQLQDGSWGSSFIPTAHHLFGLHLTVRRPTEEIGKALDWLRNRTLFDPDEDPDPTDSDLLGLPFVGGSRRPLFLAITLFLSTIFGRAHDPLIVATYQELSFHVRNSEEWHHSDMSNILRAFAVHPAFAEDPLTLQIVESFSRLQKETGEWPETVPFYQTVNALAHLDLASADRQLEKAWMRLARTQNDDGTWGNVQKEFDTFLVVHALRNKKMLK